MNTFSFEQRIFSEDGKYMYIKEYLGTHKEIDLQITCFFNQ
jgi:hypothetical protein